MSMSSQRFCTDNNQNKNRPQKNRSSVAARMSNPKGKDDSSIMPSQLCHIQDHPLVTSSNKVNNSNNVSGPNRRTYRNHTNSTSNASSSHQKNQQSGKISMSPVKCISNGPNFFGPVIPEHVMEDLLFRFLYNIPEIEKSNKIRVSFQVEQAHWFYVDFYCSSDDHNCKKLGFREFTRQVFHKCDYLQKWKSNVENIIDDFRCYKSNVPTYGLILLDSTLNYVLLVQGYFASKNSWGFPKGKVNEDEIPIQCAIREVLEETGYDATEKIVSNKRPLQCFLNDTLIRLYIATDVPMDYKFEPHLRKEIRKISWFSIWELPKDRFDDKSCKKLGLTPNNFYTVLPFVFDIQTFVRREQARRQKPKITILRKDSSAFQPVVPKSGNPRQNVQNTDSSSIVIQESEMENSAVSENSTVLENMFKPLNIKDTKPLSFTGESFLEKFMAASSSATAVPDSSFSFVPTTSTVNQKINPKHSRKDIKQPKPVHSSLVVNVYEAPPSENNSPTGQNKLMSKSMVPQYSEKTTENEDAKVFNSIFERLQSSTSEMPQSSSNFDNSSSGAIRKNIGAVGELANESQRIKFKQHQQQQSRQRNDSEQQKNKSAMSHNQGISVDLAQLFGTPTSSTKADDESKKLIAIVKGNNLKETTRQQLLQPQRLSSKSADKCVLNELFGKTSDTSPVQSSPFFHSQFNQPTSANSFISSSCCVNAKILGKKIFSPISSTLTNKISSSTPSDEIFRVTSSNCRFKIELCKAWQNFSFDHSRIMMQF